MCIPVASRHRALTPVASRRVGAPQEPGHARDVSVDLITATRATRPPCAQLHTRPNRSSPASCVHTRALPGVAARSMHARADITLHGAPLPRDARCPTPVPRLTAGPGRWNRMDSGDADADGDGEGDGGGLRPSRRLLAAISAVSGSMASLSLSWCLGRSCVEAPRWVRIQGPGPGGQGGGSGSGRRHEVTYQYEA